MNEPHKVELGMNVRDKITGLKGVAVGRTEWLNGCNRIAIQPIELKDGKPVDATWIDELTVEADGEHHPHLKSEPVLTGGPQNDPAKQSGPTR